MSKQVLIVGAGLAGTLAALAARRAGARVVVASGPAGATATWGGRLDIFGPSGQPRGGQLPGFGPGQVHTAGSLLTTRGERLAQLLERRPHHPYQHLGLDQASLATHCAQALALLDEAAQGAPRLLPEPAAWANVGGTLTVGDGCAPSALAQAEHLPQRKLLWLQIPGASRYPEPSAAALLAHMLGREPGEVVPIPVAAREAFAVPPQAQPVALSRKLHQGPASEAGKALLEAVTEAVKASKQEGLVLVPPVLGQSAEIAHAWRAALESALGQPVAELLAVEDSAHGFRLWSSLRQALRDTEGIEVIHGRLAGLSLETKGGRITGATLEGDQRRPLGELSGVVLATGRFLGGGVRASLPLREALLDLPLFRGEEVMDNHQRSPMTFLEHRPWQDHDVMNLGVGIDEACRALDDQARPAWENLFVAGRLIAGTHPAMDGSAHGVDLSTGLRAGQMAARG